MLEKIENKLGEHHSGELHRETAEAKAERIITKELRQRGWNEADLTLRNKTDPGKLAIAAKLRKETTLSLKAITARVHLGTSKSANARLHAWMGKHALAGSASQQIQEELSI